MKQTFDFKIAGIPCQIRVDSFVRVPPWPGSPQTAPSDLDYYGYDEIEYTVLDRRGREALWLQAKVDTKIDDLIQEEISLCNSMDDEAERADYLYEVARDRALFND